MTRPGQGYAPVDSIYPHKGINTLDPSTLSDPKFSPAMVNVVATDGLISTRFGYVDLGTIIEDPVMELIEWSTENGVRQLIAISTTMQYRFDKTTSEWINITQDGGEVDAADSFTAPDTIKLTGDQTSVYSAGDYIRIRGTTNSGVYKIDSIAFSTTTNILVDTSIKEVATTNAASDETASLIIPQTGDETNPYHWVVGTDDTDTYLFITNSGIDDVLWYDGANEFAPYQPADIDSGNGFKAYTVGLQNNYLMFGNTEHDGEKYFIWSNNGNFQESDGFTAGVNNDSGSIFLSDAQGAILKLENLGDRMVIYTENSIHVVSYIGGDFIFSQEQVLRETRLLSPRGIVNLGPFHLYMSTENIYLFEGTRLTRPIGDAVQTDFRATLNLDLADQAFAFHDTPLNNVYFVVPSSATTVRAYQLEYDFYQLDNIRWSIQDYTDQITCMGYFTRGDETSGGTGLTWDSGSIATETWGSFSQVLPWNSGTIREGFAVRIMGDAAGGTYITGVSQQDDGTDFYAEWQSIDFTVPQVYASEYGRWLDMDIELRGSEVDIEVSVDAGLSWTTVSSAQELTSKWVRYKFPIDVFGETCRVRLSTTGGGFSLKWLRLWLRAGGAR